MLDKKIYVFDFDGTLTTRDTLIDFIRFARGTSWLVRCLLLLLPRIVFMKLGIVDNGQTKQRLFAMCFKDMPTADFDELCHRFAAESQNLKRQATWSVMERAMANGTPVFVVSASVDNWVSPFFSGSVTVIGTKVESANGRLTGRFLTPNCYGAEKVRRLKETLPCLVSDRSHYYVIAYGDSRGDKEMFAYADESHYVG